MHRRADEKALFDLRTTAKASFSRIANTLRERYLDPTVSRAHLEAQLAKMEAAYRVAVERNNAYRQSLHDPRLADAADRWIRTLSDTRSSRASAAQQRLRQLERVSPRGPRPGAERAASPASEASSPMTVMSEETAQIMEENRRIRGQGGEEATSNPTAETDGEDTEDSTETVVPVSQLVNEWADEEEGGESPYFTPSPDLLDWYDDGSQDGQHTLDERECGSHLPRHRGAEPSLVLSPELLEEMDRLEEEEQYEEERLKSGGWRENVALADGLFDDELEDTDSQRVDGMNEYADEYAEEQSIHDFMERQAGRRETIERILEAADELRAELTRNESDLPQQERPARTLTESDPPPRYEDVTGLDEIPTRDYGRAASSAATATSSIRVRPCASSEEIPLDEDFSSLPPTGAGGGAYAPSTLSYVSDWLDNSSTAVSELRRQRALRRAEEEERRRLDAAGEDASHHGQRGIVGALGSAHRVAIHRGVVE